MKVLKRLLVVFLLPVLMSSNVVAAQNMGYPDSIALRELLVKKDFKQLMSKMTSYQKRYQEDIRNEIAFALAFDAFALPEPSYEAILNEWISQYPDSYIPLLARGQYYKKMGWHKRGGKFAPETSKNQFNQLYLFHSKALLDIDKVIAIKPDITLSYAIKIDLAKGLSDHALQLSALKDGMEVNPASYEIRKSYLYSILPRWGGSYDQIAVFLADTKRYEDKNPNLKPLAGFIPFAKGIRARERKQFKAGIALLTESLEYGEKPWFYFERSLCYYFLKQYGKALSDLTRAIELNPEYVTAISWRSWVYRK